MTQQEADYLLIGGGLASATAAATLRFEGAAGSILILCAEELAPYHRPSLSKQALLGTGDGDTFYVHPESFYREHAIDLALSSPVAAVDAEHRFVTTAGGGRIGYGNLLIATGARPKRLEAPGVGLGGIHYLRRKAECETIRREALAGAGRAVVVGASFLGMEIAMSLIALGLHVTIVEERDGVLPHLESAVISDYFKRHAESFGASVLLDDVPASFLGDGRVREMRTAGGLRVPCDLVVISIGVTPETEFLQGSGIALEDGLVVVDELLRASVPDVFAAGDVTSFYDPVFARRRHIAHWDNAVKQGRLAAKNMLGHRLRYDEMSYFFCDVGDISFSVLGAPEESDERIARGTLEDKSLALFYLKDEVPRALFSVGRPAEETRDAEGLIRYRVNLRSVKGRLHDPAFALDKIPTQTVLILQGGGALGAFECGVVKALEEEGIFPDVVAGVSIGALNGAIIAANPGRATAALESFWADLAVKTPFVPEGKASRAVASMEILMFGVPGFFKPRWLQPFSNPELLPMNWISYYDTAPLRKLISNYVDFSSLKASPVRLLVGAVDVATSELEIFDSYVDDLTPDHLLASGSLPPGFPWTVIDGKAYWDGGIVSNSPLDLVVERCGPDGKRVFVVDLFSGKRALPRNMMEVMARQSEIVYSERVRSDLRFRETVGAYRELVNWMLPYIEPAARAKIMQRPVYIELMGDGAAMEITRFVREGTPGEPASRDYDFSELAVRLNKADGYALVKKTLGPADDRSRPRGGPPVRRPGDDEPAAPRPARKRPARKPAAGKLQQE